LGFNASKDGALSVRGEGSQGEPDIWGHGRNDPAVVKPPGKGGNPKKGEGAHGGKGWFGAAHRSLGDLTRKSKGKKTGGQKGEFSAPENQ